ncbi:MAG TPA: FHA domain-containing protein [Steroidobacteraceae bacterium]
MSVQRQSVPSTDEDLDSTAELPVLEVADMAPEHAASTDTWIIPSGMTALAAAPADPSAEDRSIQLEINLRALSTSLKDVEERLTRKGERLNELERELASTRAERAAADERALTLMQELAQTQASLAATEVRNEELRLSMESQDAVARSLRTREIDLDAKLAVRERAVNAAQQEVRELQNRNTGYLETLRSLEGRRSIFDGLLRGLDHDVSDRDARLTRVQRDLASRTQDLRDLRAQFEDRNERVAVLEKDVNDLGAALAQRDEQIREEMRLGAERNESNITLTATVAARDASIAALTAAALAQSENLAELQRELDRAITQTQTQAKELSTLEAALAAANLRIAEEEAAAVAALALRNTMESAIAEQRQRLARLEVELSGVTSERDQWLGMVESLEAERNQQSALLLAANTRISELETERVDQAQVVASLQEELRISNERAHELDGDVRAAEDSIHRLEADLRGKNARLDELTKTRDDSREIVEKARRTLAERDLLMNRLETEAANSQALLGNIQQGIKRLDPNAASGSHEAAPEGAARLFIRMGDGESEVVHMLGRKTTIGRTPENDLMIDAKFISRHHAVILAGPTHTIIEDLKSTNGVLVNGRRVTRQTLKDGDIVMVGKAQFRFVVRPLAERR